jgi:putative membrane protein
MPFGYEGGFGLMWIFPLLFLAVFIYFMRGMFGGGGGMGAGRAETPREILDRRFASGEINKEEYEKMKATLSR